MDSRNGRTVAILLLISIAVAVVLTSGLANLQLQQGQPFPGASSSELQTESGVATRPSSADESLPAFRGILGLTLLVLGALLAKRLAEITRIQHVIGLVLAIAAVIILLLSLPRIPVGGAIKLAPEVAAPRVPSAEYATAPLGTPPPSFVWIAGVIAVIGAVVTLLSVLRPRPAALKLSEGLAAEAGRALGELDSGANAKNVIIRCYLQLTRLIQEERGLTRDRSITVREFESELKNLGLPQAPLLRLRALFEAVRYSDRQMDSTEEQEAIDSLRAIISCMKGGAA